MWILYYIYKYKLVNVKISEIFGIDPSPQIAISSNCHIMCVFKSLMPKCVFSRVKIGSRSDRLPFIWFEQLTKLRWSSWDNTFLIRM